MKRLLVGLFALVLSVPLVGFLAPVGPWQWQRDSALASIRVSLSLTGLAMVLVLLAGTPVALYVARAPLRERGETRHVSRIEHSAGQADHVEHDGAAHGVRRKSAMGRSVAPIPESIRA